MSEVNIRNLATKVVDLSPLAFEVGVLFNPIGNFSLARLPNGNWLCSMRRFGYYISTVTQAYLTNKQLRLSDPDKHLLLELDEDFNLVRQFDLVKNDYYKDPIFNQETPYLEDGRLTKWGSDYYLASAIFYQANQHYQKFGMEVQRLEIDGDRIAARHVWSSVEHGIMGRHKNWMPVPDKPFKFVIGTSAEGAQTIEIQTNKIEEVGCFEAEDLYRGNTALVRIDSGYLTITHNLTEDELGRKRYINYFVEYNADLSVRRISKPFKLCESNIEFVTTMHLAGNKMLVGCTEMDDTPMILEFDKAKFKREVIMDV